MKEVLNTAKMFEDILAEMELPEWLEYTSFSEGVDLYDADFRIYANTDFGGSEGIYVDFFIEGEYMQDADTHSERIGCMKTLLEDEEAFRNISALMTEMLLAAMRWQQSHYDSLSRKGFRCTKNKSSAIVYSKKQAEEYFSKGYAVVDLERLTSWDAVPDGL